MKRGDATREGRSIEWRISTSVGVEDRRGGGRIWITADVAEARAHLPAATELDAAERAQDVRLVIVERAEGLGVVGAPLAKRERVRDPAKEPRIGALAKEQLRAEDPPRSAVRVRDAAFRAGRAGR